MENHLSKCLCLNIRRTSGAVTAFYDQAIGRAGLTSGQFSMLSHIKALSPVSVSRLAEEMRLDRTTLVRNLKPLESRGLVRDIAEKGRGRQLQLTEEGIRAQERGELLWRKAQKTLAQKLGKSNLAALNEIMEVIVSMK